MKIGMIFFYLLYYMYMVLLKNDKIRIKIFNKLYIEKFVIGGVSFGNNLKFIFYCMPVIKV